METKHENKNERSVLSGERQLLHSPFPLEDRRWSTLSASWSVSSVLALRRSKGRKQGEVVSLLYHGVLEADG